MGRSPCCEKAHTNKGAWTKEEDQCLTAYIRDHGEGSWRSLPKAAGLLRCGKSCRLRWINYLRPDLKRGKFTGDEDELIIKLHGLLGNKWSLIAGRLPGRTDNEIKNYWNTHIKRKLLNHGIDPQTHCPLNATTPSPPPYAQATDNTTAAIAASGERSHSKGSSTASCSLDLNLGLSISLPHSSAEDPSSVYSDNTSKMSAAPSATPAICLCYHLGFRSSEACGCQSVQEKHAGLSYLRPLELEARDYSS